MSCTANIENQMDIVAGGAPNLARRLWVIWARETDGLAQRLSPACMDEDWLTQMRTLQDAAEDMGARKVGTVAKKAQAMTEGRIGERDIALKALRVAARLDLEAASST